MWKKRLTRWITFPAQACCHLRLIERGQGSAGICCAAKKQSWESSLPSGPLDPPLLTLAFLPSDISSYLMQSGYFQENKLGIMICEQLSRVSRFPPVPGLGRNSQRGKQACWGSGWGHRGNHQVLHSLVDRKGLHRMSAVGRKRLCPLPCPDSLIQGVLLVMPTGFCCLIFKH